MSREIGKNYETMAKQFLKTKGLKILEENFHAYRGEIDLVCQDAQTLVFVEVRYRRYTHFGSSSASVAYTKQKHLIQAAQYYLQRKGCADKYPCRFDVIGISGDEAAPIEWIKNAFYADGF